MTVSTTDLTALWAEHAARAFPRGTPESEYCGHDFLDLVELDTFLAGYISQLANGARLSTADASRFNAITNELECIAPLLQGVAANYFQSLLSVAKVAATRTGRGK